VLLKRTRRRSDRAGWQRRSVVVACDMERRGRMPVEGGGVSVRCHSGREMIGCGAGQHAYQGDDSSTKTAPGHANKGARDQTPHRDRATTDNGQRTVSIYHPLPAVDPPVACCCLLLVARCPCPPAAWRPLLPVLLPWAQAPASQQNTPGSLPAPPPRRIRIHHHPATCDQRPPPSDHHPAPNCPSSAPNHACRTSDCHAHHLPLNPRSPPASAPPRPSTVAPHSAPRPRCRLHPRLVPPSTAPGTPTASPGPTATR
jgi:hypothetical protein